VKTICIVALVVGAFSLVARATGAPIIGPPTDTTGDIGWTFECVHSDHPAEGGGGCGWIAAPRKFAFCHTYPGGEQLQLTCYSPVSGWVVNISVDDPSGPSPTASRDEFAVDRRTWATVVHVGSTWFDDRPISASVACQAAKRFFRCNVRLCHVAKISRECLERDYGVWFKPNGTFLLYRVLSTGRLAVLYGHR
jgi:hypothetical protein